MRKNIFVTAAALLSAAAITACSSDPITLPLSPEIDSNKGKPIISIETMYPDDTEVEIFIGATSSDNQDYYSGEIVTVKKGHADAVLDYNGEPFPNDDYLIKFIVDPLMQKPDVNKQIKDMVSEMEQTDSSGKDDVPSIGSDGFYSLEMHIDITDSEAIEENSGVLE